MDASAINGKKTLHHFKANLARLLGHYGSVAGTAKALNVSPQSVFSWITGRTKPRRAMRIRVVLVARDLGKEQP